MCNLGYGATYYVDPVNGENSADGLEGGLKTHLITSQNSCGTVRIIENPNYLRTIINLLSRTTFTRIHHTSQGHFRICINLYPHK